MFIDSVFNILILVMCMLNWSSVTFIQINTLKRNYEKGKTKTKEWSRTSAKVTPKTKHLQNKTTKYHNVPKCRKKSEKPPKVLKSTNYCPNKHINNKKNSRKKVQKKYQKSTRETTKMPKITIFCKKNQKLSFTPGNFKFQHRNFTINIEKLTNSTRIDHKLKDYIRY